MKKLLSLTLLSSLLLTACTGEDLEGRFKTPTKAWTMELSTSSPSGNRAVSVSDDVLVFDMELPDDNVLAMGSIFTIHFETDSDLDPLGDETVVSLKVGGATIGTGTFSLVDPSRPNEGTATITTTARVNLSAGMAKTFTVTTDTAAILAEDPAEDDKLYVSVEHNGKMVTGDLLFY